MIQTHDHGILRSRFFHSRVIFLLLSRVPITLGSISRVWVVLPEEQ